MSTTDRVRDELARLADEATPVDLFPRVVRTSRLLYLRRVLTVALSAAVVLGMSVVAVDRVVNRSAPAPLDRVPASPTATAGPGPSGEGQGPLSGSADDPGPVRTLDPVPSQTFPTGVRILLLDTAQDGMTNLSSWRPGTTPTTLRSWPRGQVGSLTVSPDGKWVAWTAGSELRVSRLDGTGQRTLLTDVENNSGEMCILPNWTSDSTSILVRRANGATGSVNAGSGAFRLMSWLAKACAVDLSADGRWMAWVDRATGRIALARPDGTERRTVESAAEGALETILYIDDISPDGRQVSVVGMVAGISSSVRRVVDTSTGETVRFLGEPVQQSMFLRDGTLLLDTGGQVALIDPKVARLLWQGPLPTGHTTTAIVAIG